MNFLNTILETNRLVLKPISSDFRNSIFESFTEEVAKTVFPQPTGDIADTDRFIADSRKTTGVGTNYQVVVCEKLNGTFIGCAGIHKLNIRPEPGLWLSEQAWGKGYGTEVVTALKQFADTHVEYEYLYYPVLRDNLASRKLAEKLGGILQPGEKEARNMRGNKIIVIVYHIYP